ncbi:HAD-IB family hydrolase [Calidifontibacter sp. DB0510]|uniref:HAD-IB family hydrolase n=1 Tax=Metallococcus carri TaxID=1656884 RepID=A0A967EAA4_9MICO|nr:HAD-IB family hydrolase [Metallococcus carri]NHN56070.1 HAD-IB family hydrolase [Metallococcus carri]NOP37473.1 HAD-IB family hydrolase [Calidifontibacter sp. DB2511S]
MPGAAFFDLDRTLIRKASGPVIAQTLRDAGLVRGRVPAESAIFWWFNRFGESLPAIALARQAVLTAMGKPADGYHEAAEIAAEALYDMVEPYAHGLIKDHQDAGRPVVLATTTPYHLIKPLADRLGLDDVIATRYAVDEHGRYNGQHDGRFVWSWNKLASVREWAAEHDVDLKESHAYSDSVFDAPLLSAVGHPHAVNPDPRLHLLATAKRWPVLHLDVAPGTMKVPLLDVQVRKLVMELARPETMRYARFQINDIENIPAEGPAILAGNHRSYFDMPTMMLVLRTSGRTGGFLAKREMFDLPVLGHVMRGIGGIRVDRDRTDGDGPDPLAAAVKVLAGGELVGILPEGTIPRGLDFFSATLEGFTGVARLAALSRAPVIPFALGGTEQVWPRSSSLPHVWNVTDPPTVTVNIGTPVELKYRSEVADTRRILNAIVELLPEGAGDIPVTSLEQVASSYPGGRIPEEDLPAIEAAIAANTAG